MTAILDGLGRTRADEILGPVLRTAHEIWLEETACFLNPVILPEASFWERWTTVRYLADQFLAQFHRERNLLEEIRPLLPPEVAKSLLRKGERIGQLQQELDRVGRRRGTARTVSVAARGLLASSRAWCSDIEAAIWLIRHDTLPEGAKRLVTELELYTQTHRDNRHCLCTCPAPAQDPIYGGM